MAGFAFMSLMALSRVDPSMFRIKSKKPPLDERDLQIKGKAMIAAYWGFWPIFVLMAMAPFFMYGPEGKVSVIYLSWMVFIGMFVVFTLYSIAILNEYGWRDKGEKSWIHGKKTLGSHCYFLRHFGWFSANYQYYLFTSKGHLSCIFSRSHVLQLSVGYFGFFSSFLTKDGKERGKPNLTNETNWFS